MSRPETAVQFGKNVDQIQHPFRHVDALGLDRETVVAAISEDLRHRERMPPGSYIAGNVVVRGLACEYRAFGLDDGTVNIGRIAGV